MVRIRLRRVGAKKQPSYRIVVADARAPRDGRFIEVIGIFNPRTEPETVKIEEARALYWLSVGAQPSDAVMRLLKKQGTVARADRLKKGESLEKLVAEAESALQTSSEASSQTKQAPVDLGDEPDPEEIEQESDSSPAEPQSDSETAPVEAGDEDDAGGM